MATWKDDVPLLPQVSVYEEEPRPVPTGVLNAKGQLIYRQPVRNPIGFQPPPKANS